MVRLEPPVSHKDDVKATGEVLPDKLHELLLERRARLLHEPWPPPEAVPASLTDYTAVLRQKWRRTERQQWPQNGWSRLLPGDMVSTLTLVCSTCAPALLYVWAGSALVVGDVACVDGWHGLLLVEVCLVSATT